MMNMRLVTRVGLVLVTSLAITFLLGISRISMMTRMEVLGLYEFGRWDYFVRIGALFLVCAIFLSMNVFYNRLRWGPLHLDLMQVKGILILNLLIFIPVQTIYVSLTMSQIELFMPGRVPMQAGRGLIVWAVMTNLALMVVSALVGTVYRFMQDNYYIKLKNETLQKESAEARFANLKEQLNPHFLFNSFSTLNGLIDESPQKAKNFVHNMSDVYRYVLKNEGVDKVALKEEMEFAGIYLSMVKERFGDAVQPVIELSEEATRSKVPPLAIQMLIENAVKHNNFDNLDPLRLTIRSQDAFLEVKNSLRERHVEGNHALGLYNLNQRYKYLSKREVIIRRTPESFVVQIPLLQ